MANTVLTNRIEAAGLNLVVLTGVAVTTTSGTLSTVTGENDCEGFTVAKTASEVGRYTATISEKYRAIQYAHCVVEGAADAAAAAAKGQVCYLRGVSASGKEAFFQMCTPSLAAGASVDVEVEDAAKLRFIIVASTGSV